MAKEYDGLEQGDRLEEIRGCQEPPELKNLEAAKEVFGKVKRFLLRQPGVTAVDVGFKIDESVDRFSPDVAVRVHVENKHDPTFLRKQLGRTPCAELEFGKLGTVAVEYRNAEDKRVVEEKGVSEGQTAYLRLRDKSSEDGVPLDVIEARYLPSAETTGVRKVKENNGEFRRDELLEHSRDRVHPLVGGISIGSQRGPAGTLGAVVWDRTDGAPCLLSNWHVLAGSPNVRAGEPCFQPAFFDGGTPEDLVGRLKRWRFDRYGDAALAQINSDRAYSPGEILGLWVPVPGTVEPWLGMPVRKSGRSTGFTKGFIDGIHFTTELEYRGLGMRHFEDQVHIAARYRGDEVSAPGDSGSIWVTKYVPHSKRKPKKKADESNPGHDDAKTLRSEEVESRNGAPKSKNGRKEDNGRVYYAVALHFAGDQPGAKTGEFAVASPLYKLAEQLKFSFRPVFFPQSDLVIKTTNTPRRELGRSTSDARGSSPISGGRGNSFLGPQPEPELEDPPPKY